jgi:hypothetical protein
MTKPATYSDDMAVSSELVREHHIANAEREEADGDESEYKVVHDAAPSSANAVGMPPGSSVSA